MESNSLIIDRSLPPRKFLEEYRDMGYPKGLKPITDAILELYESLAETHKLAYA